MGPARSHRSTKRRRRQGRAVDFALSMGEGSQELNSSKETTRSVRQSEAAQEGETTTPPLEAPPALYQTEGEPAVTALPPCT